MIDMTPHLVVMRDAGYEGTKLSEFWALEACHWDMGDDSYENPPVKLYIAPFSGTRDVTKGGLPSGSEKVRDSCSWDEVPEDVRDEFRQQAQNLSDAMRVFGEQSDDDNGDESDGGAETEDEETVDT